MCVVERRGPAEGPSGLGHQSEETTRTERDISGRRPLSHQSQRERGVARQLEESEGEGEREGENDAIVCVWMKTCSGSIDSICEMMSVQ